MKEQVSRYVVQKAQSEMVLKLREGAKIERMDAPPPAGSPGTKPGEAPKPADVKK